MRDRRIQITWEKLELRQISETRFLKAREGFANILIRKIRVGIDLVDHVLMGKIGDRFQEVTYLFIYICVAHAMCIGILICFFNAGILCHSINPTYQIECMHGNNQEI